MNKPYFPDRKNKLEELLMANLGKWIILGSLSLFVFLTVIFAYLYFGDNKLIVLKIAAGNKNGESYQIAEGISKLLDRYYPGYKLEVIETRGSEENIQLLEKGQVDLATTQADISATPSSRIIATLYQDLYQLVARENAGIESFEDLKGKRVVLPEKGGGQWLSFWFVAQHYGINENEIEAVHLSVDSAAIAMAKGNVDALFRVRAAPHEEISHLVMNCNAIMIPIDQGPAMRLRQPAVDVTYIPVGAYRGSPPVPFQEIPTLGVKRLLIAGKSTNVECVRLITELLFDRRRELMELHLLAGFIEKPDPSSGSYLPLHEGARLYYERENPSFVVRNADFMGLLLSIFLMLVSGGVALRGYLNNRQKNISDVYTKEVLKIADQLRMAKDSKELEVYRAKMIEVMHQIVDDLDHDRVNSQGFQFFTFAWNYANTTIRERERFFQSLEK